ncbi:MAG: M23 family metallopeptidase [Anaerolineae bacterium]|jgi:murein DD-endopeptidase MepM/ murein hydrolase activator NlpD
MRPTVAPTPTPTVYPLSPRSCIDRAVFGERAASAYVLPYPVGESYMVLQSVCSDPGSHRNQLAYDFEMPIGADVTAARGGVVMLAWDNTPDIGTKQYQGQANYIYIRHEDGTVAFYAHLKQDSVTVGRGDQVKMGQRIAASGNSGYTGEIPHLHFGVYAWWPPEEGYDVPVNFRNATAFGALLPQGRYLALEY